MIMEKVKWYWFIFFARIRTKKEIKRLEQRLWDLSWTLSVEKSKDELALKAYYDVKVFLFINMTIFLMLVNLDQDS